MALTDEEKKQLDEYFEKEVGKNKTLKEYATVRDDLDTMRNFESKGYGKTGTFTVGAISATATVASLALTGVNIGITGLSKTIRGFYFGFNLGQASVAGNGDEAALKKGWAALKKSLIAPITRSEAPVEQVVGGADGEEGAVEEVAEEEIAT